MSQLRISEAPVGANVVLDGRRYVNFGGSSYLGLASNRELRSAGLEAAEALGFGYQFPRHYGIATRAVQDAESEAARFFDAEAAFHVPGGYYFGLIAVAALRESASAIFYDEWSHFTLYDGIAASGLPRYAFRHLDAEDLERMLRKYSRADETPLVVTDGIYSTYGQIAPLDKLWDVAQRYEAKLLVDESHALGVLGAHGRGACEHHGIDLKSVIIGGSTAKGLGALGGILPGSQDQVSRLWQTRAARGASSASPAAAAMCARNLRYVREHPELLLQLRTNIARVKAGLRGLGLAVDDSVVPIAAFTIENYGSLARLQERLMEQGVLVLHSKYIGAGADGVIRCSIFADHTEEHLQSLFDALRRSL